MMRLAAFRSWYRVAIAGCAALGLVLIEPAQSLAQAQGNQDQAGAIARAFLQAEAQEYVKTWLNQHPPVEGVEGFGGKAMFAVQLILAADAYAKADTDKARFHAVLDGAAAYVAYSYSATPAVGLIVTAVYLVVSIVEANIAGSYAEAMLAIQKDMIAIQMRLNDLIFRNGLARANRLLALVDTAQRVGSESAEADLALSVDCGRRAGDYAALAGCLERMTKSVVLRRQLLACIDRLLDLPTDDLAMLGGAADEGTAADGSPKPLPKGPSEIKEMAEAARAKLQTARDEAAKNLIQIEGLYEGFASVFDKLAVSYMTDEALAGAERLAALDDVRHRCLVDHTTLSQAAATVTVEIATVVESLRQSQPTGTILSDLTTVSRKATNLLAAFEQRRLSCPAIAEDATLRQQIDSLGNQILGLGSP